jgi:MoaA/NifB/PqqE/SkfB family radical SAM enzyme
MINKNISSREEKWGQILYDVANDEFRAEVIGNSIPTPKSPVGIGWIIIGGCNLKCIHCYGNAEALPSVVLSTNDSFQIVDKIIEAGVMRVVISGGEPLLRDDIFPIMQRLVDGGVSVILGTNGSFIDKDNVNQLKICTRVEISLDASTLDLNNKLRPSRQKFGNAWQETLDALSLCVEHNVQVRVLTTLNSWNQNQILDMAKVLSDLGIVDWALSWTVPAGRARGIYELLQPDQSVIEEGVKFARIKYPSIFVRYSNRGSEYNRFYCLILPDGQIATEDVLLGHKVTFGSLLEKTIPEMWNTENFNLEHHFRKWVGGRITSL